jgi:chromatin remodeling complex protein RSC6
MVRATATKTAPAASEAKKAAPAAKKEKTTTPATKKEKAVAAAPAPVAAPVVAEKADETVASEETDKNTPTAALMEEIAVFNTNFAMCQSAVNAMKANLKNITKLADRVSKNAAKSKKRKNTNTGKKSGFEKPTLISDDLAAFFGKPKGTLMARTEVSKGIHKYVVDNNLQKKENRRIIHPDAKLKKLLDSKEDEITYFNLQKYLKCHFIKDSA